MLVVVVLLYIHSGGSSATTLYVHRIKEVIIIKINWNFCRQLIFVKQRVICEHKPPVRIHTHTCMHAQHIYNYNYYSASGLNMYSIT